ncbi:MAG: RadC family protein [Oscillospiraceae bacterium]
MPDNNIHKGHRQRMLKRFNEHGIDSLEDHEVLEILLYSVYAQRNTNDIAHELIQRFGSLNGVLSAEPADLCEVKNVGPNAAVMLKFFKEFAKRHSHEDHSGILLCTSDSMREYCSKLLSGHTVEVAHALFLDDAHFLRGESVVSSGNSTMVEFDLRKIVRKSVDYGCSNVVLAHNHPHGVSLPSKADVATTRRTYNALYNIGINLVDHIVVGEDDTYSMRTARLLPELWL